MLRMAYDSTEFIFPKAFLKRTQDRGYFLWIVGLDVDTDKQF